MNPDNAAFPQPDAFWARLGLPGAGETPAAMGVAWMQAFTQFLATRLRADADALAALSGCTRPAEIAEVQQRWLVELGECYASTGARMMRLAIPTAPPGAGQAGPGREGPG